LLINYNSLKKAESTSFSFKPLPLILSENLELEVEPIEEVIAVRNKSAEGAEALVN